MTIFFVYFIAYSSARPTPIDDSAKRLWEYYNRLPSDSISRAIDLLFRLQNNYALGLRQSSVDSVTAILMERVRMCGNNALAATTVYKWFTNLDRFGLNPQPFADTASVAGYIRRITSIAQKGNDPEQESQAWYATARYRLARADYNGAGEAINQAWYAANLTENTELKLRCLLLMGYCEEFQSKKLEAFRHYSDALYLARKLEDPDNMMRCYEQMFDFYCGVNNYERAEDCIYKILPMLLNAQPPDSPAIMHQLSNLVCLQLESKEYDAAIRNSEYVLDYAARNDTRYLERPILVLVKSVLMEAGEYRRLKQFFHDRYPAELANIARTEPAVYYQLKAAFAEADNQPDTANKYYRLAGIEILAAHGTPGAISFYLRHFGKFLLHLGKHKEAIRTIDSALHYAVIVQYHPYMAELSGILDSLYAVEGDYVRAYQYAKLNKQYNSQLLSANRQDEILALDLENEIRAQALLTQQEEERTRHRHNVQYMSITLLIGIFFGILLMLDVFRMPVWLISAMSFISFIFLFEFIILLIDHKVHEITHGEPWMILAIKVVIIAGLLPLHHWLEHSVVDYLRDHHLMANAREKLQPAIQRMRHFAGASSKSLSVIANERPKADNAEEQARPDTGPVPPSATIQEQLPLPPSG